MKTGNFPGKVNNRRKKAQMALKYHLDIRNKAIAKNNLAIKELEKVTHLKGVDGKNVLRDIEELIIRNKAILAEIKPINAQLDILEKRIVSDEVARATRTKKDRRAQGRRRRFE